MATFTAPCRRARHKMVITNDGRGRTSIPDGVDEAVITIEIDVEALVDLLGPRAMASKARKAVLAGGDIVARASNMRRLT